MTAAMNRSSNPSPMASGERRRIDPYPVQQRFRGFQWPIRRTPPSSSFAPPTRLTRASSAASLCDLGPSVTEVIDPPDAGAYRGRSQRRPREDGMARRNGRRAGQGHAPMLKRTLIVGALGLATGLLTPPLASASVEQVVDGGLEATMCADPSDGGYNCTNPHWTESGVKPSCAPKHPVTVSPTLARDQAGWCWVRITSPITSRRRG